MQRNKLCHVHRKKNQYKLYPGKPYIGFLLEDFKLAIKSIFNELKKTMSKELKENTKMMSHQMENNSRYKLQTQAKQKF